MSITVSYTKTQTTMSSKSYSENWQDPPDIIRSVTTVKREKFSLIWSINQFGEFLNRKYEFSSPVLSSNSPGTSKWKLVIFPENVYPDGVQVALRLFKVSSDDKYYSVKYTISLIDNNGKDHLLQTREKVFRSYLDCDESFVTSNTVIKEKSLLQNNGTLTVCCKMDLLVCENPDDTIPDSLKSWENIKVPATNDLSAAKTYDKPTENISCSPTTNDLSYGNPNQKYSELEKDIQDLSDIDRSSFRAPTIKTEYTRYNSKNFKHKCSEISSNEWEKKTNGLSEKIDSLFHKTRDRPKNDKRNSKNVKDLEILSDDLSFLYNSMYQHDIIIHTHDGQVRAHKAILAARSEYFRKILALGEKEINIPGINSWSLDAVLYYMYTGQSPQITYNQGIDILTACDLFKLDHLKDIAQNSLKSQINISNVIDILHLSKEMDLENLKICALTFVAKNHEAVTKTAKWNEMLIDNPHAAGEILLTIASFQKKSNNMY